MSCWQYFFTAASLAVALLLFTCASQAQPSAFHIDPALNQINLVAASYVLEDPEGNLTLEQVQLPGNAGRFRQRMPDIGFSPSAWWLRFTLVSDAAKPVTWWFDSQNRTLQEIAFFSPDENGVYQRQSASSTLPFAQRPLNTADFVFPVILQPGKKTEIYVRVRSTGYSGVNLAPRFWQPKAYQALKKSQTTQWLLYLGMAGALGLFNLMLAIAIRDTHYFLYTASVAGLAWSISSGVGGFGSAYEYFWPNSPLFEQLGWLLSTCVTTCFNATFFLKFANFRTHLPRMTRFVQICVLLLCVLVSIQLIGTVLDLPDSARILQKVYIVGASVFSVIYIAVFSSLGKLALNGNRQAKFLCIAWLPAFFSVCYWVYLLFLGQTFNVALTMWASAFELILMSLALADMFNQERKAKERAQAAAVDALRKSEYELEGKVAFRTLELEREQQHNKQLLHNILPVDIATELSNTGQVISVRHTDVSILFTDFIGFTQAVSTMPADKLLTDLNEIFAAFDDITDACGVEKIKTIGDAYMAAAGLPRPCTDHAQRCVRAAFQMIDFLHRRNLKTEFKWFMRIGIHSGPAVSGVVGKRKFAFDIWGDTVNLASRIESAGENGRVNVSAYTCELIQSEFECQYRGKLATNGMGAMDMYFVTEIPLS